MVGVIIGQTSGCAIGGEKENCIFGKPGSPKVREFFELLDPMEPLMGSDLGSQGSCNPGVPISELKLHRGGTEPNATEGTGETNGFATLEFRKLALALLRADIGDGGATPCVTRCVTLGSLLSLLPTWEAEVPVG